MPVTLNVIEDGHIIYVKFVAPWKAEEMIRLFEEDRLYRDEVLRTKPGQKVHLIAELVNAGGFPPGALQARNSPSLKHPTSGYAVVVGTQSYVIGLGNAVFRLARFEKVKFVETTEEALAFLKPHIANSNNSTIG